VLTAVDTATGAERWSMPDANYETSGSGVAVVIDHDGLEGLDATTGEHLWTAPIPDGYTTAPDTINATTGSGLLVLTDQCDFE
jgi:outer membrane protein assembly factor BamB